MSVRVLQFMRVPRVRRAKTLAEGRKRKAVDWRWLFRAARRGGSTGFQPNNGYRSDAYDHAVVIMARYQQGEGIKPIAASLGLTPQSVGRLLNEGGIRTAARRNYDRAGASSDYRHSTVYYHGKRKKVFGYAFTKRIQHRLGLACSSRSVKQGGAFRFVGCSAPELRAHLEKQFTPGMSWANYGAWHIDHITPCASFDLTDEQQVHACFNWRNLQPLWALENILKSDSVLG